MGMSTTRSGVQYADRWLTRRGRPGAPLDADEARRRHEEGKLYTVVLGDPERPTAYLDVRNETGFVGVHFLDDAGRPYLTYHFARDPGSDDDLFLEQATYREYEGDEVVRGDAYHFEPDGKVVKEHKDYVQREAERGETRDDVSSNWEPVPEFGSYESIARVERR
jgi:hypothetical protein